MSLFVVNLMGFEIILCSFESKLPQIFEHLHAAHKNIQARLQAEQFKVT